MILKKAHSAVIQDMKNLKAEVDLLKRTVQSLIYIQEEAKVDIKEPKLVKIEVKQQKTDNLKIEQNIQIMEEDLDDEFESESDENEAHKILLLLMFCSPVNTATPV